MALFFLLMNSVSAQTTVQVADLMRDKNITWIAESYNDFIMEQTQQDSIGIKFSTPTRLKFLNPDEKDIAEDFVFQSIFMDAIKKGKVPIYKDEDCKIAIQYESFKRIDTVKQVSPTTYQNEILFVEKQINPREITLFRAHQIIYYDSAKVQFGLKTLAIAPMKKRQVEAGALAVWDPIFWVKATDLPKQRNLNDKNITWAQRMNVIYGVKFKGYNYGYNYAEVLKITSDSMPMKHLIYAFETKLNIPFYTNESSNPKVKIPSNKKFDYFTTVDTLMRDSKMVVDSIRFNGENLNRLGLVQNWYWNSETYRLEIWLMATAPIYDNEIYDQKGTLENIHPIFYRRTDD